ncbi:hypothetical protein ISS22_06245 [candidate division KSB1 bacterium]|nr:hypothetical protein [candidate division KSB1 bacterium]
MINEPKNMRPHVVILGAGASVAAFPQGDASGKKLPTMDNLIEVVGLRPILDDSAVDYHNQNFEELYSQLYEKEPNSTLIRTIENTIRNYFEGLQLPEEPTLYDHLMLSLRPKDIVATFNWDPFLHDVWERHRYTVPVPEVHLHGNVRIACCIEHQVQGENGMYCPHCDEKMTPSRLLYPVAIKNYADLFINKQWEMIESCLRSAFTLTIFGYGAPETDKEAFELMTKAWKGKSPRELETMEIIDTKEKQYLMERWKPFIPTFHCMHSKDFYKSGIAHFPRRSCEGLYVPTVLGKFAEPFLTPKEMNFKELMSWLEPLIEAERLMAKEA